MVVTIRPLLEADRQQVLEVARTLASWFRPLDQMALAVDVQKHSGLVATVDEEIVGFLTYRVVDEQSAELTWFGVLQALQSRGVGSALLHALESALAAKNIRILRLSTVPADYDPTFAPTNAFYARHGFVVRERDDHFYAYGRPGILMEKILDEENARSTGAG